MSFKFKKWISTRGHFVWSHLFRQTGNKPEEAKLLNHIMLHCQMCGFYVSNNSKDGRRRRGVIRGWRKEQVQKAFIVSQTQIPEERKSQHCLLFHWVINSHCKYVIKGYEILEPWNCGTLQIGDITLSVVPEIRVSWSSLGTRLHC